MNQKHFAIVALLGKFQKTLSPNVTKDITEAHNNAYADLLEDLPIETIQVGLKQMAASECIFYPSAATIRNKCIELSLPTIPTPAEAWEEVQSKIAEHGYIKMTDQGMKFNHPVTNRAVESMGLRYLCFTTDENVYPRFRDIYNEYAKRGIEDARMLPETKEYRAQLIMEQVKQLSDKMRSE